MYLRLKIHFSWKFLSKTNRFVSQSRPKGENFCSFFFVSRKVKNSDPKVFEPGSNLQEALIHGVHEKCDQNSEILCQKSLSRSVSLWFSIVKLFVLPQESFGGGFVVENVFPCLVYIFWTIRHEIGCFVSENDDASDWKPAFGRDYQQFLAPAALGSICSKILLFLP